MKQVSIIVNAISIRLPERTKVEISDPEDADEFLEDLYGVKLRLSRRHEAVTEGPLLSHARTDVGPFAIDEMYSPGYLEASPDPLNKVIALWATSGEVSGSCDGLEGEARAGDIALLSQPHLPHRCRARDIRLTSVVLDQSLVAGVATGLPSTQAPLPVRFCSFAPIDAQAARLWKDTVSFIRRSLLAHDAVATPLVLGNASRMLAAVTLSTFPNSSATSPTPHDRTDAKPVLLRRAMEYMDANATNDIGLTDIAEAVHVTPRAVQYMFRRHLETTPLQYLRRLRLHYAHQELLTSGRTHSTVTEIAARWGFAHTGRFAVLYRQTYGQSPHSTLRG
ncbi:AraC family transcriptional regulator [Mycobacterium sp. ACS1612]|nr:AraC family transcriptional regulator [Mycobacterium sp. ACS1612]